MSKLWSTGTRSDPHVSGPGRPRRLAGRIGQTGRCGGDGQVDSLLSGGELRRDTPNTQPQPRGTAGSVQVAAARERSSAAVRAGAAAEADEWTDGSSWFWLA